ncbi:hypothetical protein CLUG_04322 [Clavispora lusitaniae ATCC 42720]|uniref:Uncharacterized protein n=1 Tax=Clavispora lusitaniae (strain ATCC 42720) TaxID=306902 RepID=C4Y7Z4_CLAL4|nr:uncharacterized protein CLUG_04322 [Clavispora lusitaniae ATCC 42720]EEQ40195.1 hypothetical protein CLUG_04322 [Clavispora lusitaniae ATCC 42720]
MALYTSVLVVDTLDQTNLCRSQNTLVQSVARSSDMENGSWLLVWSRNLKRGLMSVGVKRLAHRMDLFDSVSGQRLLKHVFGHGNTVKQVLHLLVGLQSLFLDRVQRQGEIVQGLQQVLGKLSQRKVSGLLHLFLCGFSQVAEVRHRSGVMVLHVGQFLVFLGQRLSQLGDNRVLGSSFCFLGAVFALLLGSFCLFFLFFLWFLLSVFGVSRVESERKRADSWSGQNGPDASRRQASRVSGYGCVKSSVHGWLFLPLCFFFLKARMLTEELFMSGAGS